MPVVRAKNKRGRPSKFGRPSRLVALTLPEQVIRGLRNVHPDLAWAIVGLFEKRPSASRATQPHAELFNIDERGSLIVVNRSAFKQLPGVGIVPVAEDRAFLALEPGCGFADLETAVNRRIESPTLGRSERTALLRFRRQLRGWRRNRGFHIYTRSILVVERVASARKRTPTRTA